MRELLVDLARWITRARPARGTVARALAASSAASLAGAALFIGAPYLLIVSAPRLRPVSAGSLAALLILIELLAFLRSPLRYSERLSAHDVGVASVTAWRRWLIVTVGAWTFSRWSAAARGDLLERALTDTDILQDLWLRALVPLCATVVTMLAGDVLIVVLPSSHVDRPTAALALVVVQGLALTAMAWQLVAVLRADRDARSARSARTSEGLTIQQCAREIELLGRGRFLLDRFARATALVKGAEVRRDRSARTLAMIAWATPLVALVAVVATAHTPGLVGRGDLVALLVAVALAEWMGVVATSFSTLAGVSAATGRLDALGTRESHGHAPWPSDTDLEVSSLTWAPPSPAGDVALFDGLRLAVRSGRRVAITGANGAGKSALLRALARLEDVEGVSVGGVRLEDIDENALREHVAHVSAEPALLDGVVDHVIRVGRASTVDLSRELAEVGLTASAATRWEHLSRGESQRAALVRGLLGDPQIVLLDEPTSGLGPTERELVLGRLSRLGVTVIIATHDPVVAAWCDVHYELIEGRLHEPGI